MLSSKYVIEYHTILWTYKDLWTVTHALVYQKMAKKHRTLKSISKCRVKQPSKLNERHGTGYKELYYYFTSCNTVEDIAVPYPVFRT